MNKLEANISLLAIVFFSSFQCVFLSGIPEDISAFLFLCVTNFVGFIITTAFFYNDLFRIDAEQIKQSAIISLELIGFNLFLLFGAYDVVPSLIASVSASYFVFVMLIESVIFRTVPKLNNFISVIIVLTGLIIFSISDLKGLLNIKILYLMISDIFFAIYTITLSNYSKSSNPAVLAMGQTFFCFVFSLILWVLECLITGRNFEFPMDKRFLGSVIYTSFFIRGLFGIIQMYAQRYLTALNTSLIFSSALIITMIISPLLTSEFGIKTDVLTFSKIFGGIVITIGLLTMEPELFKFLRSLKHVGKN